MALLDTGASLSVIQARLAPRDIVKGRRTAALATPKARLAITGTVTLSVGFCGYRSQVGFHVAEKDIIYPTILGRDWLRHSPSITGGNVSTWAAKIPGSPRTGSHKLRPPRAHPHCRAIFYPRRGRRSMTPLESLRTSSQKLSPPRALADSTAASRKTVHSRSDRTGTRLINAASSRSRPRRRSPRGDRAL